jgi:hypothetical protein
LLSDILGLKEERPDAAQTSGRDSTETTPENAPAWLKEERYHIIRHMQRARKRHLSIGNAGTTSTGSSANYMGDILRARRGFRVTDPRDMIFAHVGFASDGQHKDLAVDYSKTTVQVYESSGLYIAKILDLPALLECVGRGDSPERIKGLPSWVPDWTCKIPTKSYPTQRISRESTPFFPELIPILLRETEPGILCCIFSSFDTVRCTSRTLSVQRIPQESRQNISSRLPDIGFTSDGTLPFSPLGIAQDGDILTDAYELGAIW